jgi:hypothetical protein
MSLPLVDTEGMKNEDDKTPNAYHFENAPFDADEVSTLKIADERNKSDEV